MIRFNYKIKDPIGLHARSTTELVKIAKQLDSTVEIYYNNKIANATMLIKVMSLGIVTGADIVITISGGNEEKSYEIIKNFFESNL